jgi:hypothetical protein
VNETVTGRRWTVADGDVHDGRQAGDFQFHDLGYEPVDDPIAAIERDRATGGRGIARLAYNCPRTGKPCGEIAIGHPDKPARTPSWRFDGNVEAPTLTPSINCTGGCGWHGFLTAGVFKGC